MKKQKGDSFYQKKRQELINAIEKKKAHIRQEPSKFKRFWKWILFYLTFIWIWAWKNVKDCLCLFAIVVFVYSGSVWIFYAGAIFTGWNTELGKSLIAIGSGVWAWWMSPLGSPFILLCVVTTLGIKALIEGIKAFIRGRRKSKDECKIKTFIKPLSGEDSKYVIETIESHPEWYGIDKKEDYPHSHYYGVYDRLDNLLAFFCCSYWQKGIECILACVYVIEYYRKQGIFNKIVKFFKDKNSNVPLLTIGAMDGNDVANEIYNKKFHYSHHDNETGGNWYIIRDSR